MEERHKTNQNVFLPWKKDKKQTRMYFCYGRKTKNKLECISAMEEIHKTNQNVFLPWKKDIKQTKMYFSHGRKT